MVLRGQRDEPYVASPGLTANLSQFFVLWRENLASSSGDPPVPAAVTSVGVLLLLSTRAWVRQPGSVSLKFSHLLLDGRQNLPYVPS